MGPFTISERGAAPTDEVTTVLGAFVFERSDPLLGILRLIRTVQTSRLPATKTTALLVALQKALPHLAPNGDRTAALARLEKFLLVFSVTKAKSLTPELRAFIVDTVTELQATLAVK